MKTLSRVGRALARRVTYGRYFLFARRNSHANLRRLSGPNILVLCYGNIYRSPFVGKLLADLLPDGEWSVRSAGFHDREGRTCREDFIELAATAGVDLRDHQSRRVTEDDLEWADLIVIMDGKNRLMLHEMSDTVGKKVAWISAWTSGFRSDVVDPYEMNASAVEDTVRRLTESTAALARELIKLRP